MRKKHFNASLFFSSCLILALSFALSACSNPVKSNVNDKPKYKTIQTLNQQQKVETGTVISVRSIQIKPPNYSRPSIGIAASSGGFRGVYGSIDMATLGGLFTKEKTTNAQEIIVTKANGNTVAITQVSKEKFTKGESIKILQRDGKSIVIK